ncbi:MAG: hypothetical protein ACXVAG_11695 [Vulcanimicrobiaceae bacterium]
MKRFIALILTLFLLEPAFARAATLPPGLYRNPSGHLIYVGVKTNDPIQPKTNISPPARSASATYPRLRSDADATHASATLQSDFAQAGMVDFSMRVYKNAGHTLKVSATGFNNQPSSPERLTSGYPEVMIQWLDRRGFLH